MATVNRKYPEVPVNVAPDVPHHVNLALRAIDADHNDISIRADRATVTAQDIKRRADAGEFRGLPGTGAVPADAAVAAYLATPSATRTALKAELSAAADPLAYLNSIDVLCSWETRPAGTEETYPQAVSINEDAAEIYVANQGGTLLRIDVRNLDGTKKSSRSITTNAGAYTQGLPWFYNGAGDLCFIIRPGSGINLYTYAIYNYTRGTMGGMIPILGDNMCDIQGDKYISADAGNFTAKGFYVYDFKSLQAGAPILLSYIPVQGDKKAAAKNQGVVANGGYFFLLQGAAQANPCISVYDMTGSLVTVHDYASADFADALNQVRPGAVKNPDSYTYENEAGCKYRGRLATLDVVNNSSNMADSRTYVVLHNMAGGVTVPVQYNPVIYDTGWVDVKPLDPFTAYSPLHTPQVRRTGNTVQVHGSVKGLPTSPSSEVVFRLAPELRPVQDTQFIQMSSVGYAATWQIGANGDVKILRSLHPSPDAGIWYPLPSAPWYND